MDTRFTSFARGTSPTFPSTHRLAGFPCLALLAMVYTTACGGDGSVEANQTSSTGVLETSSGSTTNQGSSQSTATTGSEQSSSFDATSSMEPTSSAETSSTSGSTSDTSSDTGKQPLPKEPVIVVKDQVKLCGAVRWTLKDFKKAFSTKNQLILQGGTYPANAFELHGKLRFKDLEVSVDSKPLDVFIDAPGKSHGLAVLDEQLVQVGPDQSAELTFRLTATQDGNFNTFEIDAFNNYGSNLEYKSLDIISDTSLDVFDGFKGSAFGPCETPNIKTDVFRFELENNDWVEFETKSQLSMFDKPTQHGLTVRAKGSVKGVSFDVDAWEDLIYGSTEFSEFPRPPSLAVRFPEQKEICGIGFKADFKNEELPYKAQILDCELKVKESPKLLSAKYPDSFEVP